MRADSLSTVCTITWHRLRFWRVSERSHALGSPGEKKKDKQSCYTLCEDRERTNTRPPCMITRTAHIETAKLLTRCSPGAPLSSSLQNSADGTLIISDLSRSPRTPLRPRLVRRNFEKREQELNINRHQVRCSWFRGGKCRTH